MQRSTTPGRASVVHWPAALVAGILGTAMLLALPLGAQSPDFQPSPSEPGLSGPAQLSAPLRSRAAPLVADAVRNLDTGLTFASIQDALDAAGTLDGHTLQVEVAVHDEGPVSVVKSVTLQGQTGSEVVRMTQDTGSSGDARGWFLVAAGVDLTVRDLGFDGNGFKVFQAFRHRGTGLFERVAFQDIQFEASGPAFAGTAIVAFGGNVTVRQCTFEQIGRVGVLFFGPVVTDGVFDDNVYIGKGDGSFLDYALEIGAGAFGSARGNVITGNRGEAPDGSDAAAFLVTTFFGPGSEGFYEGNNLFGNVVGISAGPAVDDASTVVARCNRIVSNTVGLDHDPGIGDIDADNNWWGCNGGPGAAGCDIVQGAPANVSFDPWLLLSLDVLPNPVSPGQMPVVLSDLNTNSDLVDISATCTVPDDIPVDFAANGGTLGPPSSSTQNGAADSVLTPTQGGTIPVSTTVDNETVTVDVEVLFSPAIPTLSEWGLMLLGLVLAWTGWVLLRRRIQPR